MNGMKRYPMGVLEREGGLRGEGEPYTKKNIG